MKERIRNRVSMRIGRVAGYSNSIVTYMTTFWNGDASSVQPVYWSKQEIDDFNRICRKLNHLVKFRMNPEVN